METRDAPKLRRVRRLDSIRLDKNDSTYFTNEGYLVDHPILTSCGIFEYTSASIQLVKSDEILPLIFILEFNGISSMLAIKNECPKLNIRTFIIKRAFLSGIIMLLFSFLLKSLNY